MAKPKHLVSLNHQAIESPNGRFFVDPGNGATFDLSDLRVCSFRTDTVRQLYHGRLRQSVLGLFEKPGIVQFAGAHWYASRIGRDSGFQYSLQNADLGVILLIKSFHVPADQEGHHLKIELSPHFIQEHTERELQFHLDVWADDVLTNWSHGGVAVHVACDVQGWTPPADFETRLHCRSRRVRSFHGIDEMQWDQQAARYGRGQSFLFGSAGGMQLAVYDKTDEATAKDRLDYWRHVWDRSGCYDPSEPVTRIELRFHHSVVNQFADGSVDTITGEQFYMSSYEGVYQHLSALWRYGMDSFRFLLRPGYFHPVWSVLARQVLEEIPNSVEYKRHYKSSDTFSGKNIELLLGNFISCATRHQMTKRNTWEAIKNMPFWEIIRDYYHQKGKDEKELRRHLYQLHDERVVRYGRAV